METQFYKVTKIEGEYAYIENEEKGFDGESMSDWFTGSGCVLGKVLFFCVFGVRPNLQGVEICPAINKKFNKLQDDERRLQLNPWQMLSGQQN
mgnify:CR=1 FL=1